jgi:hypothetical protein
MCRVWYDGVAPGRQPAPTSCAEANRVAGRNNSARVIYGQNTGQNDGYWGRDDRGRAIPRTQSPYPYPYPQGRYPSAERYPSGPNAGYGYSRVPYDNGYEDGLDKGREDGRDNDSYDPVRHSRYRSADHGYNSRYGSKDDYKNVYRAGFSDGYDVGYRETVNTRDRSSSRFPWPF